MAHAPFAPSKSNIWLACPGSINMTKEHDLSSGSTAPAREGTAAHWVSEKCLTKRCRALDYIGAIINVEKDKICCDQEMVDSVQMYIDEVNTGISRRICPRKAKAVIEL